ncbi:MAG: hypothetical protein MUF25_16110, partial [Pirellulaceae bacterium]|nr:hypothetical protein [Pirellulaceae bacterium]
MGGAAGEPKWDTNLTLQPASGRDLAYLAPNSGERSLDRCFSNDAKKFSGTSVGIRGGCCRRSS